MIRTGSITSSGAHGYLAAPVQHGASRRQNPKYPPRSA